MISTTSLFRLAVHIGYGLSSGSCLHNTSQQGGVAWRSAFGYIAPQKREIGFV
jgi:hypothetical protein